MPKIEKRWMILCNILYVYTYMWQAPKTSSEDCSRSRMILLEWLAVHSEAEKSVNSTRFQFASHPSHPHPFTTQLLASRFNLIASFIGFIKHVQLLPDVLQYINVYNTILWIMCRGMKFSRFPQQKKHGIVGNEALAICEPRSLDVQHPAWKDRH